MALKIPLILGCFFIVSGIIVHAQEPFHINYTTENGLPSNEVYCVYQDTAGYMWFGTENGISRYDGYTFKNYGYADGLSKLEINKIIADAQGKVWFSSYFGQVYYLKDDKFYPYSWNDILGKYKKKSNLVDLVHIDNEGTFYFKLHDVGLLKIAKNGKHELISPGCGVCEILVKTHDGHLINCSIGHRNHPSYNRLYSLAINDGYRLLYIYDFSRDTLEVTSLSEEFSSSLHMTLRWNDTMGLFNVNKKVYLLHRNKVTRALKPEHIPIIYYRDKNDLYIGYGQFGGLQIFRSWETAGFMQKPEQWLTGIEVSFLMRDRIGGLWVTSINNGLYYIPNDKVKVYRVDMDGLKTKFNAVFPIKEGSALAANYDGSLLSVQNYNVDFYRKKVVFSNPKDVLKFDNYIFGRGTLVYNKESIIKKIWPATYERKIKTDFFYGSDRHYIYQYLPGEGKFKWIIDQSHNSNHIWDIFRSSDGQVWLATVAGVKILKNSTLVPVMPELSHTNTISVDQLSTGQMVFGTKGKGVFVYDEWECNMINITAAIGLSTDLVEYLWVDDNDHIWVATLKGLNKIYRNSEAGFSVRQFHQRHGLPSEDINMVRTYGKDIWLATSKGLAVFREPPLDYMTYMPDISNMYINDKKKQAQDVKSLAYEENSIRIELYNLDYTQSNHVQYRYRLQKSDEWTQEPSNTLNFINLITGNYRLEIQAANKDGFWSESLVFPFTILPPWWLSWYFIIFSISVIGLLIFLYYRSRIKIMRSEQMLKNQMLTYEKQALLAQMNPHFIFNAFSAIQYYINTKATKKADDYLTDFSYLIRKILDNSGKKDILLSEEIKLLTLYTQLEARRFDNKFMVNIFVDDEIDTDVTRIPCMLIQPLVENAINHGLMHLTERKGQLQINFMDYNGSLRIVIEDNGVGMEKSKGTSLHKMFDSYGLKLLDNRISSYRNSGEYYITLTHEDLYEGIIPSGTRFIMDIAKGKN